MIKTLRYLICFVMSFSLLTETMAADNPSGGKGQIKSDFLTSCFKASGGTVTEVCGSYTINWKMWSLMGEPVADYNLAWNLRNITLMDRERKQAKNFTTDSLPEELKNGASKIELYIDAYATVGSSSAVLHFNTGTSVRTGKGSSFNVPESANWDRLFQRVGFGVCEDKPENFIDAPTAKKIFLKGINFSQIFICSKSGVSELNSLENAIGKLCEPLGADKRYSFCPKQKEEKKDTKKESVSDGFAILDRPATKSNTNTKISPPKTNSIDDAFAKLDDSAKAAVKPATQGGIDGAFTKLESDLAEKERQRLAALKARQEQEARDLAVRKRHDEAVGFCTEAIKSESQCIESSCGRQPEKTICTDSRQNPSPPCNSSGGSPGVTYYCLSIPTYSCYARGTNPKFSEWESCSTNVATKCHRNGTQYSSLESCVAQRETSNSGK